MKRRFLSLFLAALMVLSVFAVTGGAVKVSAPQALAAVDENPGYPDEVEGEWIGAWGSGMTEISFADYPDLFPTFRNVAARIVLTPTANGNKLRLRLSNVYGKKDLVIKLISVNNSAGGSKIPSLQPTPAKLNGKTEIVIPPGEEIVTDPINFKVTANKDIAVTIYIAETFQDITSVGLSGAKTYFALNQKITEAIEDFFLPNGNFFNFPLSSKELSYFVPALRSLPEINVVPILSGVDVFNTEEDPFSVVVIGDSTVANEFPYYLSKAIAAEDCTSVGVVGKGIIGNSLIHNGEGTSGRIYGPAVLNRMKRDVLALADSGVRYAVIKIGANDITHPESESIKNYYGGPYPQPTAEDLIEGFTRFTKECHKYGIKVVASTITQWKGTTRDYFGTKDTPEYKWTAKDWKIAQDVNAWMLDKSRGLKVLDGVVDLAAITASETDSAKFRSEWTSDFIHPNDKAQMEWANAFPLEKIGIKTIPASILVNPSAITLAAGKTFQLEETIYPETAQRTEVKWTSNKPSVAIVGADGTVKALRNGTATITCTTVNGKTAKCRVTVQTPTTGVTLSDQVISIYATQTHKLSATVKPSAAEDKSVKWTSSDESIATVSSKGTVTGKKAGKATITCTTKDTGKSADCVVIVKKRVAVKGLTLNATTKTVYKGKTYQLKGTFTPSNASNKTIKWSSTDPDIAIVSTEGKITGVKNGTAYIYAVTQDGGYTAICKVKVKTHASGVKLNTSSKTIYIGKTYTLTPSVTPSTASNKNVKWKSSDKSVATVNSKGVVTGKKAGTATITCTTEDGAKTATCKIKVTKFYSVKSVSLNKKSVTLDGGEKYQLKATINPTNASEKGLKWTSSDTKVAKVSSSGKITALRKGTATITCTTKSGNKTATCKVRVISNPVTGVSLNKKSLTLGLAETAKLTAILDPLDATYTGVTWKSGDKTVAKVSSSGKVTAIGTGTCYISCITDDGEFVAKCKVTVIDRNDDVGSGSTGGSSGGSGGIGVTVKLDRGTLTLPKGTKYTLKATASDKNATLIWTTDKPGVATVTQSGVVTAVGQGECNIRCKVKGGEWQSTCKVTVK